MGCCGWREARARYFAHFPVVELQDPFYDMPRPSLAARWRAAAPAGFQFSLKAWQLITHTPASPTYRRLKSQVASSERDLFGSFRPTGQVWLAWERTREALLTSKGNFDVTSAYNQAPWYTLGSDLTCLHRELHRALPQMRISPRPFVRLHVRLRTAGVCRGIPRGRTAGPRPRVTGEERESRNGAASVGRRALAAHPMGRRRRRGERGAGENPYQAVEGHPATASSGMKLVMRCTGVSIGFRPSSRSRCGITGSSGVAERAPRSTDSAWPAGV